MTILPKKAVVLLSGGLDSTTAAALAREKGYSLHGLTVFYGQVHECELQAAKRVAKALGFIEQRQIHVPIGQWGGSALVQQGVPSEIPLNRRHEEIAEGIPNTYVPARNTIFLSLALAWAEVLGAQAIFLGVNALDYSGYPDCRPEFLRAFEEVARLGTKVGVEKGLYPRIEAPLLNLSKAQIIQEGIKLGIDYALTHSCYKPNSQNLSCGRCDSCQLRLRGFAALGLQDPLAYQT